MAERTSNIAAQVGQADSAGDNAGRSRFVIGVSRGNGCYRVALQGEFDLATAPRVAAELARIDRRGPGLLIVDLRGLEFMDLQGLRVLLAADERALQQGRDLVVVRGPRPVQRLLELAGAEARLHLVDDPRRVWPPWYSVAS